MQEASKSSEKVPSTLEECLALIASLTQSISIHEAALKQKDALIETQAQAIDASLKERDALQTKIDEHTKTIERLLGIHQKRRERFDAPRPLFDLLKEEELDAEDEAIVEAITEVQENLDALAEQVAAPNTKPRKKRNYNAPAHWPRVEVPYQETDPTVSQCEKHGPREIIGYETREKAVMVPAKFYVEQTKVPKFKCVGHPECGIKQQPAPEGLVKGDKIDTSIAAQIVVQKHMFHVPLYRTEDIFASCGWNVARGTLLNLLCSMAYLYEGLYNHYRQKMVAIGPMIATDDTIVKLILPDYIPPPKPCDKWSKRVHAVLSEAFEKDKSSINARMWAYRSIGPCPWNVFDFTISRHRDGPERFLEGFQGGVLLGDCYAGYDSLRIAKGSVFQLASCNAHARRKLHDAMKHHPKECSILLAIYRELYDIESLMKHTATGRKNWLFLGSIEAGYRAAILTTICSTAHRHHLDVYAYVKEVADRLLAGDRNYESMQAENWAKAHPEHVRQYREEETRYAAERKKTRREKRRRDLAERRRNTGQSQPNNHG